MRSEIRLHTFDNPDGMCIVINVLSRTRKILVYELSDDINHILKCIENWLK